ncbi:hypothetical protein ViNHUV68_34950 [Vibrio sp. NH-UV-68]
MNLTGINGCDAMLTIQLLILLLAEFNDLKQLAEPKCNRQ